MKTKVYLSFNTAYNEMVGPLTSVAKSHLFNQDWAIDAVHDAFTKVVERIGKGKNSNISTFLLHKETLRACRRINQRFGYGGIDLNEQSEYNI